MINEFKLSSDNSMYLGLRQREKIFAGYSLLDILYWEYLTGLSKDKWNLSVIHLSYF